MLHRIHTWLRVVLPADWTILVFFGLFGSAYLFAYVRSWLGDSDAWDSLDEFRIMLIWCTAVAYSLFRATYFNPVENLPYGRWLKASSWRHLEALPLGPIQLVWQDVVIIGVSTALLPRGVVSLLSVATLFLVAYSLTLSYSHWKVAINRSALISSFLGGVLILVIRSPIALLLVAALMYAVAYLGTRQMLRAFPFERELQEWLSLSPRSSDIEASAGWPLPPVNRSRWSWRISHAQAAGLALCIGWLQFYLFFHFRDFPEIVDIYKMMYAWVVILCLLGRLWVYFRGYAPPISILGRVATLRLVIPGYDVAFIAPLITAIVAYALPEFLTSLGMYPSVTFPISSSVVAWLALALPPRREDWHLTGHHRIAYRFFAALATRSQSKAQASR
ncbi:MAG TPA: hypothetical protein VGK58_23960 [Lacipirellulaceae bacterium]